MMSVQILQQIQELEEWLHSLEEREKELSHEDTLLHEKLLLLQREQRLHPQPLRQALDQTERSIGLALEQMSTQRTNSEAKRRRREEEQERREKELKRRIQEVHQRITQSEERFPQQKALVLAQISDLDQDLVRQEKEHEAMLEKVEKEEKKHKNTQLKKLVWDKKQEVQASLLWLWKREVKQNERCFLAVTDALGQTAELQGAIKVMSQDQGVLCKDTELKRQICKNLRGTNKTLTQDIWKLSRWEMDLSRRRMGLNKQKMSSLELTHKLSGEWQELSQKQDQQSEEIQGLKEEQRRESKRRKHTERSVRRATEVLQEIIQTCQTSSSPLVQKMLDLLHASSSQISDSDFALFCVRHFHGDHSLREESEQRRSTLTDPLFLLTCVRRCDVMNIWPCSSWTHASSAPSPPPSAPHPSHRSGPVSLVRSGSEERLCELEQYQQRALSPVDDLTLC